MASRFFKEAEVAQAASCEDLLRRYEALQADPLCRNAKRELVTQTMLNERTLMRRLAPYTGRGKIVAEPGCQYL